MNDNKTKNMCWNRLYAPEITLENIIEWKQKDFPPAFQNCVVLATSKMIVDFDLPEFKGKSGIEILEFCKDYFTDNSETRIKERGFITNMKNIGNIKYHRALELKECFTNPDIDYIVKFKTCLVIQRLKEKAYGHVEYIKAQDILLSTESQILGEFDHTLILLFA